MELSFVSHPVHTDAEHFPGHARPYARIPKHVISFLCLYSWFSRNTLDTLVVPSTRHRTKETQGTFALSTMQNTCLVAILPQRHLARCFWWIFSIGYFSIFNNWSVFDIVLKIVIEISFYLAWRKYRIETHPERIKAILNHSKSFRTNPKNVLYLFIYFDPNWILNPNLSEWIRGRNDSDWKLDSYSFGLIPCI